jgi:PBP1b-binding outer membrane lipoprotein LpoB
MKFKCALAILLAQLFLSGCSNMVQPPPPCAGCERVPINIVMPTV